MLSQQFIGHICSSLGLHPVRNGSCSTVGGGCINRCYRMDTTGRSLFVKVNKANAFPGMFAAEEKGLALLRQQHDIRIPSALLCDRFGQMEYLVLEWVAPGRKTGKAAAQFGAALATMHRISSPTFGLDHDNYIGSLPQRNKMHKSWSSFFAMERLDAQIQHSTRAGSMDAGQAGLFASFYAKLDGLFPPEPPALLHGDLWGGNYMITASGEPCIFDPAVYYGHREMDIAMSRLFGGFDPGFYAAYNEVWPLEQGWEERLDVCNLYPLLVHHNLFGGVYLAQALKTIKHFI